MSTKDKILNAQDTLLEKVYVPEWDADVYVRGLMSCEKEQFKEVVERQKRKEISEVQAEIEVMIFGLVDENNNHIFDNSDIPSLLQKAYSPINRLSTLVMSKSGFGVKPEELEKN